MMSATSISSSVMADWSTAFRIRFECCPIREHDAFCAIDRHVDVRPSHDPQAEIRRIPALLPQGEPEDRQAAQSRNLQVACSRGKARAGRAIFQATLSPV